MKIVLLLLEMLQAMTMQYIISCMSFIISFMVLTANLLMSIIIEGLRTIVS